MTKKILEINLDNKIKFDIFSQAEENLYIELLIKTDEKMREKASEYARYLEDLKKYVEFENEWDNVDEMIKFLNSKSSIDEWDKKKYMEDKFDLIDWLMDNIKLVNHIYWDDFFDDYREFKDKSTENRFEDLKVNIRKYFPVLETEKFYSLPNKDKEYIFLWDFFNRLVRISWDVKTNDKKYQENNTWIDIDDEFENDKYQDVKKNLFKNIFNLEDLSFNDFLLIPFLIPVADVWFNWNRLIWEFKILKFKFNDNFYDIFHKWINNQKQDILNLFNKFMLWEQQLNFKEKLIKEIFPKTNLFCDYRFFDRSILE